MFCLFKTFVFFVPHHPLAWVHLRVELSVDVRKVTFEETSKSSGGSIKTWYPFAGAMLGPLILHYQLSLPVSLGVGPGSLLVDKKSGKLSILPRFTDAKNPLIFLHWTDSHSTEDPLQDGLPCPEQDNLHLQVSWVTMRSPRSEWQCLVALWTILGPQGHFWCVWWGVVSTLHFRKRPASRTAGIICKNQQQSQDSAQPSSVCTAINICPVERQRQVVRRTAQLLSHEGRLKGWGALLYSFIFNMCQDNSDAFDLTCHLFSFGLLSICAAFHGWGCLEYMWRHSSDLCAWGWMGYHRTTFHDPVVLSRSMYLRASLPDLILLVWGRNEVQ